MADHLPFFEQNAKGQDVIIDTLKKGKRYDAIWNKVVNVAYANETSITLSENQQGSFIVTFAPPVSFEFSKIS